MQSPGEKEACRRGSASDPQPQSIFRSGPGRLGGPLCLSYPESKPVVAAHRAGAKNQTVPSVEASGKRAIDRYSRSHDAPSRGDYAALGLLILHRVWQGKGLGSEAASAIENMLSSELDGGGGRGSAGTALVAALLGTMRLSVNGRGNQ